MPCIFCVLVLSLVAGALTSAVLDDIEVKLAATAVGRSVRRVVDSESVSKFELAVRVRSKNVPVAVTVFKDHRRVRIQILTHDLNREEVAELEDKLAAALDAEIVDRSDPVHEASAEHAAEHAEEDRKRAELERERMESSQKQALQPRRAPRNPR